MKKLLLQLLAALLCAALLVSLWEPAGQGGNVWFALVPLLLLTRRLPARRAAWLGWVAGFAAWVGQLWWMLRLADNGGPWPLVVPALLGLSAVLACFVACFAGLSAALRARLPAGPGPWRVALALAVEPALWAGLETLRGHLFTGFAWNPLGLACTAWLPLAQTAALGGAALVSAQAVAVNGAVATLCERIWGAVTHTAPTRFLPRLWLSVETVLPLAALLAAFVWGLGRIRAYDALPKGVAAVVVEGTDAPCRFTGERVPFLWERPEVRERAETLALLPRKPDLWLWPESAVPGFAFPDASGAVAMLRRLSGEARTPLLVGGLHRAPGGGWYNAALLFTDAGLGQVYGKRHLVPFGEYIPFDKAFPWLQRFAPTGVSNVPGEGVATLTLPSGLVVGPLICFEDTVARVARESVNAGARLLLNMSNDAWYAPSAQGAQHARQAILRCIETGVPMARATNGGVDVAIDAVGRARPIEAFPTYLPLTEAPFAGPYLAHGELVFGAPCATLVCCLLACLLVKGLGARRPRGAAGGPGGGAALLLLLALLAAPAARAQAPDLIPAAGMALDDGNLSLAERTARDLLATLGLTPEERARATEILIRADLARGDWAAALARIDGCPELPAERRLVFTLAALNGRKDFAAAQRAYDAARPPTDTLWGVAALRQALQADLELGRTLQAAARFSAVDAAKGADSRARAENALAWSRRFPNAQSRAALLRAAAEAEKGGVWLDCALALPEAYAEADDRAQAAALLDRLLAAEGLSSTVEARLALAAARLAQTPEARVAYARRAAEVARREDLRREALSALGALLCAQGDPAAVEEGLGALAQAVRLDPSAPGAPALQLRIAETLAGMGRLDEALVAYDRWLESYDVPELRIRVRRGRGRAFLAAGRPDEALASLTEAVELAEGEPALRRELQAEAVDAALAAKRYARAESLCRELLKETPGPAVYLRLARALEAAGDLQGAREAYAQTRDDPAATEADAFVAALRLGALLAQEGRWQEAIAAFSRFLPRTQDPARQAALRLERGRAYHALGQLERAREDFAAVSAAADPAQAAEARFFLVLCLYGLGEDERARALAQEYLAAYPDSPRVPDMILWLAKSDFNRGDYAAAAKGFEAFAERWPGDPRVPNARFLAARAAYQGEAYAHAVELVGALAKATPQAPILPDARFLQAEALIELARHGEAAELLAALIRRTPEAPWLGDAYGRLGDCLLITATDDPERYAQALQNYREARLRLEQDPDAAAMYDYKIGRVYEKQGRPDAAAEQYARLLYGAIAAPARLAEPGRDWLRKARARLAAIEIPRGNRAAYDNLLRRLRAADLL